MKAKSYVGLVVVGLFGGLAAGCKDTAEPSTGWTGKVAGFVRDTSDKPLGGLLVTVQTIEIGAAEPNTRGRCTGVLRPSIATRTSNTGQYSVQLKGIEEPVSVCVFVDAAGLSGGRLIGGSTELDSIAIGPSTLDSVHVDVVARR